MESHQYTHLPSDTQSYLPFFYIIAEMSFQVKACPGIHQALSFTPFLPQLALLLLWLFAVGPGAYSSLVQRAKSQYPLPGAG